MSAEQKCHACVKAALLHQPRTCSNPRCPAYRNQQVVWAWLDYTNQKGTP